MKREIQNFLFNYYTNKTIYKYPKKSFNYKKSSRLPNKLVILVKKVVVPKGDPRFSRSKKSSQKDGQVFTLCDSNMVIESKLFCL